MTIIICKAVSLDAFDYVQLSTTGVTVQQIYSLVQALSWGHPVFVMFICTDTREVLLRHRLRGKVVLQDIC